MKLRHFIVIDSLGARGVFGKTAVAALRSQRVIFGPQDVRAIIDLEVLMRDRTETAFTALAGFTGGSGK